MVTFITHNQALLWSRIERIIAACAAASLVTTVEFLSSGQSIGLFGPLAAFAAQLFAVKCWIDVMLMSKPHKNCWEFKE